MLKKVTGNRWLGYRSALRIIRIVESTYCKKNVADLVSYFINGRPSCQAVPIFSPMA